MSENDDDAQRSLEKKALQNVRGLVDKVEAEDRIESGTQKKALLVLGVAILIALVGAAVMLSTAKTEKASDKPAIEIPPPTKPAVK